MGHAVTVDIPVCELCGYELAGLKENPPGTVLCPECAAPCDLATTPRLHPWPSRSGMARRLCGPFAANMAVFLVVLGVMAALGVDRLPRVPTVIVVLTLMGCLPLTGLVHPALAAMLLTERHAIRPRRTAVFTRVFGAAVGVNFVVLVVGYGMMVMMDAW